MGPFDFLNAINDTKVNVMVDDIAEKQYLPFIVNRGLSYFLETVLYANEMNQNHHLDKRLQFDYLINSVSKKKRFSKWAKADKPEDLELIKAYYGYSNEKARYALTLLSTEQIQKIRAFSFHGGAQSRASSS
jgi:hypothetical protein